MAQSFQARSIRYPRPEGYSAEVRTSRTGDAGYEGRGARAVAQAAHRHAVAPSAAVARASAAGSKVAATHQHGGAASRPAAIAQPFGRRHRGQRLAEARVSTPSFIVVQLMKKPQYDPAAIIPLARVCGCSSSCDRVLMGELGTPTLASASFQNAADCADNAR